MKNSLNSGNMEVLVRYGTKEQKEKWLKPLLEGKIRSCFAMTGIYSEELQYVHLTLYLKNLM
jgi:alkylation response protein AidB-like acyl-CoA dehydrogenase